MNSNDQNGVEIAEPLSIPVVVTEATRTPRARGVLMILGVVAFLYFARPVVLPIVLLVWRE